MSKTLEEYVVTIPDFPEPGIMFRDITSVIQDPDPVLYARTGDLDRTWPASVLENSMPASECQPSDVWGLELRWLLWATCSSLRGFRGPPGVGTAVGSESLPLPGSPSLGHGRSSGGLPGNYSNFPAYLG